MKAVAYVDHLNILVRRLTYCAARSGSRKLSACSGPEGYWPDRIDKPLGDSYITKCGPIAKDAGARHGGKSSKTMHSEDGINMPRYADSASSGYDAVSKTPNWKM